MNINSAIIDQKLKAVCEDIRIRAQEELKIVDADRLKSLSFVYLSVKTMLDLTDDEAFECLTEGGGDFGIDALHLSEVQDGEFTVSVFQGKYKKGLEADSHFPENGINALVNAIRYIFNPESILEHTNNRLKIKIESVRSLIMDGFIPQVRALACNNGMKWNESAEERIKLANFGDQVTWEHVNHDCLVMILQASKPVNDSLQLTGKAIIEDFNYSRVLVARISVGEIAALIERHGERLLERNIRRYLGLQGNRVNEAIRDTLKSSERSNFYFYNNGITITCDKFTYNALQSLDYQVKIDNLQIINGGQTCMTIYKTLRDGMGNAAPQDAFALVRIYQLPSDNDELVSRITCATNSQNPVDLRDLRSNDNTQRRLETDIHQLGFVYKRKRTDSSTKPIDITSGVAAEAILSTWRQKPHQAKFFTREHFGKLYDCIFTEELNGAQVVIATLLYRIAENKRKRPPEGSESFIPYASCFIAMQMSAYLLLDLGCTVEQISHVNFERAKQLIEMNGEMYFALSATAVGKALKMLYGDTDVSLQQLSATFRRGDLISKLHQVDKQTTR